MKKLLYLFISITLLGCTSNEDDFTNNSNNSYFFEIELGGVTYKIQGNANGGFGVGGNYIGSNNNCTTYVSTMWSITLAINDKSESDYVSGDNITLTLYLDNPRMGSNTGRIGISGTSFSNYLESLGGSPGLSSLFIEGGPASYVVGLQNNQQVSNINITDLGTATSMSPTTLDYDYGETVKGSYEGVLYFIGSGLNFEIPLPISIKFSSVRLN